MIVQIPKKLSPYLIVANIPPRAFKRIVIHHTAFSVESGDQSCYGEFVDLFHRSGARANYPHFTYGMGYHFLINPNGVIEVGQRWLEQLHGAHIVIKGKSYNQDSIGIALMGNFEDSYLASRQRRALVFLLSHFKDLFDEIYPHRFFINTLCPGKSISDKFIERCIEAAKRIAK